MHDVRFCVTANGLRSSAWRARASRSRPEVFLEREGSEKHAHVSLHESGDWHMKVDGEPVHLWRRPDEFQEGFTRAVVIVQPCGVASFSVPPAAGTTTFSLGAETDTSGQFDLFLERPGANLNSWPGKGVSGTSLVARLPFPDGLGTCCVTFREAPFEAGSLTLPRPANERQLAELLAAQERGDHVTFFGSHEGALLAIDFRLGSTPAVGVPG